MPPGRALRVLSSGRVIEAQILLEDPAAGLAGQPPRPGEPPPRRLAALPDVVSTSTLCSALATRSGGITAALEDGVLPIGFGGNDLTPLGPAAGGCGWLVAGAAGSGRSTALATAAHVLLAARRAVVVVAASPSPLANLDVHDEHVPEARPRPVVVSPWSVRNGTTDLAALLDRHPCATLVVDDVTALADTIAEDDLLARLDAAVGSPGSAELSGQGGQVLPPARWPISPGPYVLAGCTPGQAATAFRGLAARLRTTGSGLLLAPNAPGDGDAFGIRTPSLPPAPPGRATLITGSELRTVQVAAPERR
jgi:S-DNA-T family DNA segregation ATPase FtsK/SpoIIIE